MKLQQGQIWVTRDSYLRIVQWERLQIVYKQMPSVDSKEGTLHEVSKKEFCRLIKGATLHQAPPETEQPEAKQPEAASPPTTPNSDTINPS